MLLQVNKTSIIVTVFNKTQLQHTELHQLLTYLLAITMRVYKIQTPKMDCILSSFFVMVLVLHKVFLGVVSGGMEGGLNVGV